LKSHNVEAVKWYRKAAEQGYADAQSNLGWMYGNGKGVKQDDAEAVKWFRKAAEQGNSRAQHNLGEMYFTGKGVKQDYAEAVKWFRKAAVQGYAGAQFVLGAMYSEGKGVKQSNTVAVMWYRKAAEKFRKAAEQGDTDAQYDLGVMYYEALGVKKDYAKAAKWYLKAAKKGNTDAQLKLSEMYEFGIGVKQDDAEVVKWLRKAAEQGDADGQLKLGNMYIIGQSVKKDYYEAAKWYRKAAEQGDVVAMSYLAKVYSGRGLFLNYRGNFIVYDSSEYRDDVVAADWYYKAGLSYLKQGRRDEALHNVEWIKKMGNIANAFLANKLLAKIYGKKPEKADEAASGTAWPVAGGYVVTNHHVIAGHRFIVLLRMDGVKIPADVAVDDVTNDLVLLKPRNSKLLPPALPLANRAAQVGGHVFTVGYPHPDMMGKEPKLTDGIINARTGIQNDPRVYQISVPLQGGNSGGPLLNMSGEVVGITTTKMSAIKVFKWTGDLPQNVNYAVKVGYVRALLSSVDANANIRVLPSKKDNLAGLAKRIEGSVLMVIAK